MYLVTDVPSPGCVQVTVTLATRIQLQQTINREGMKYTDSLLVDCVKELVRAHVENGIRLDPNCSNELSDDPIFLDYGDFDLLVAAARSLTEPID
jgi:hypothetical protein